MLAGAYAVGAGGTVVTVLGGRLFGLGQNYSQTLEYIPIFVAGALLAFALSFDEIVVTNFTSGSEITIPKFIFNNMRQPRNRPIVNVVAVAVVLLMVIPVYFAQRLAGRGEAVGAGTTIPAAAEETAY